MRKGVERQLNGGRGGLWWLQKAEGGCQWSGEESTVVRGGMKRKKYKEEE